MRTTRLRRAAATLAAAALLAACGDDDTGTEATASTAEVTTSTTTTEATAPSSTTPTTSAPEPDVPAGVDADEVIVVTVSGGQVEGGGRHAVPLGSRVALVVTSDADDEIHLHGYDLTVGVVAGEPAVLAFDATIPGVFEAELHDAGLPLVELEVS